ncbi:hypothetical protein OG478_13585 [Streptomyces phaeochromogenes]|uniref:hypothetical protein n=1 Tax=Streptomyces phaeochromogenes TaxID=1923 RepID=UPI003863097D|nr:hypothetical protein OG478_13585 [Streptomyces phaeochromogenes]
MTTRIPPAHNHLRLALSGYYTRAPEPARLPGHLQTTPLLWASPHCPPILSTSGRRPYAQAEDPRPRIADLLRTELGDSSAWDLIRQAEPRDFELITVENVIETAVWLSSQNRGE